MSVRTLLVLLALVGAILAYRTMTDQETLNDSLFKNYTAEFLPAEYLSDQLEVVMVYHLLSVIDFNVVSEVIKLSGIMVIKWYDYRLQWDPEDHGGVDELVLPVTQVWSPRLVLLSGVDGIQQIGSTDYDVKISNSSLIFWNPSGVLMSTCKADMRGFPADRHNCTLVITSMIYTKKQLVMFFSRKATSMDYFSKNGEWEVTSMHTDDNYEEYEKSAGSTASFVAITICLKRKSHFFIINTVIPIAVLCLLESCVFLIPVGTSDRVSFSLTLFLALAVYMSMVGAIMPTRSEPMSGMTYFLLGTVLHCTTVVVFAILTVRLDTYKRSLPICLVRLFVKTHSAKRLKKLHQKCEVEPNENIPLAAKDHELLYRQQDIPRQSLLNFIDKLLFVGALSSMITMCAVFYLVYQA